MEEKQDGKKTERHAPQVSVCDSHNSVPQSEHCVLAGAFFLHAGQDGLISRQIREVAREWLKALRKAVDEARRRGEIRIAVNAKRTAFELNSLLLGAQWSRLLDGLD